MLEAGEARCQASLSALKAGLAASLADVRHALAAPRHPTQDGAEAATRHLNEHLTRLVAATAAAIKDRVTALQVSYVILTQMFRYIFPMLSIEISCSSVLC